ncbi:MAG: YfhO family protein, partial [Gemmatimonadota bacterium]
PGRPLAARIAAYSDERVEVELPPGAAGFLVLADTHYPGWRARVDGLERPILEANHAFRAVAIGPGDRRVAFDYRPASYRLGLWISGLALAAWATALVASRRRRLAREDRSEAGEPALRGVVAQAVLILVIHAILSHPDLWAAVLERSRFVPGP